MYRVIIGKLYIIKEQKDNTIVTKTIKSYHHWIFFIKTGSTVLIS